MVTPRLRLCGRRVIFLALLLGLAPSGACSGDDGPSGPASGPGTIAGTVTRQKTGLGVPDIVAVLMHDGAIAATTHTDEAGRFRFPGLATGSYTVRLTGYDIAGLDARFDVVEPESRSMTVPDAGGDLVFTVVGVVAPRINGGIECGGLPAGGAQVRVIGGRTDTTVTANAVGRYALLDLDPGRYAVIPVGAPCAVEPKFHALELRPGQSGDADFAG